MVVNTDMNIRVIAVSNGADMRVGGCSNVHFANISRGPAPTFRVATLLENVFVVKIVHVNLFMYSSDCVEESRGDVLTSSPFFQLIEAKGVKGAALAMGLS